LKLSVKAERETSAQTGLLTSLWGLFCARAMCLPKKIVYDIRAASAESRNGCRVNVNTYSDASARPMELICWQILSGCPGFT
jgi:hypothetical protein